MQALRHSVPSILQQATVIPCLHWRLLDAHRQVWVSLLWGHCSFLLGPGAHRVLFVPSESLFPQSCVSSVITSPTGLQSQIPWGFSVSLPDPQVGKSVVGPRTFLTVWELIWYNCSAVCGSSAQWLYGEVNGNLLHEGLCHMLCDPALLHPVPQPLRQATADQYLHGRFSDTQRQVWLSLCEDSGSWCTQAFVWALWASLAGLGLILNVSLPLLRSCWGFSFALECAVSLFGGIQHSPVNGSLVMNCNFGVLTGEDHNNHNFAF